MLNPTRRYTQTLRNSSKYLVCKIFNDDHPFPYLQMKIWRLKQQERYICLDDFVNNIGAILNDVNDCVKFSMLMDTLYVQVKFLLARNSNARKYFCKLYPTDDDIGRIIRNDTVMYLLRSYCEMPTIDYISLLELNKLFECADDHGLSIDPDTCIRVFNMIANICKMLPDNCKNDLKLTSSTTYNNNNNNNNIFASQFMRNNKSSLWFNQIQFKEPAVKFSNLQKLQDIIIEPIKCKSADNFSMWHSKQKPLSQKPKCKDDNTPTVIKYDHDWIMKQIPPNCDPAIIDILTGQLQKYRTVTNDKLQNILLEILGYNEMEFIELLINKRKQIVETLDLDESKCRIRMDLQLEHEKCSIISKQITVQTQEQKQLIKKVLKENNNLARRNKRQQTEEED